MELLKCADFARRHNVSRPYISKLVKHGKIVLKDGRVPVEEADKLFDKKYTKEEKPKPTKTEKPKKTVLKKAFEVFENVEPSKSPAKESEERTIYDVQREHEEVKLEIKKIELEQKRGNLVEKALVEREGVELGQRVRAELEKIPALLAPRVTVEDNEFENKKHIESVIKKILNKLSNDS